VTGKSPNPGESAAKSAQSTSREAVNQKDRSQCPGATSIS
jgi:hypothetical protein